MSEHAQLDVEQHPDQQGVAYEDSLVAGDVERSSGPTVAMGVGGGAIPAVPDDLDAPRPEESDPLQLPWWLTEKVRAARARRADERVPDEEYYAVLAAFFSDGWIKDVLLLVKSGKEATVYCCAAHPSTGYAQLAAKVYRPVGVRHHRNRQAAYEEADLRRSFERKVKVRTFTWDARYREGRSIGDARLRRAFERHTRTGRDVQNTSWARAEFDALRRLHAAGAAVPRPLAQAGNAVLMEYVGDANGPAPLLQSAEVPRNQAETLFWQVIEDVALWLDCGLVHADLSGYNLLYWQGRVTAIDFPQAVDAYANPHAFDFLCRDVANVARCFARHGVSVDAEQLAWTSGTAPGAPTRCSAPTVPAPRTSGRRSRGLRRTGWTRRLPTDRDTCTACSSAATFPQWLFRYNPYRLALQRQEDGSAGTDAQRQPPRSRRRLAVKRGLVRRASARPLRHGRRSARALRDAPSVHGPAAP